MNSTISKSPIHSLPLIHKGKVRDTHEIDSKHLLIVTTDRLSAFDVILPTPIPEKGRILTQMANFWFNHLQSIIPNHLSDLRLEDVLPDPLERAPIQNQAIVVKRMTPLPIEAIVRGYLIGSGWKDYQATGTISGIRLPTDMRLAEALPEPIFTPSTKAQPGEHDTNITLKEVEQLIGVDLTEQVRSISLSLYQKAALWAESRGILIADTKFEFGLDPQDGTLTLIDEVLTPDSSRFWPIEDYEPGHNPPSFDKQFVRDYLETLHWNKKAPGPELPMEIVEQTTQRYEEALQRLLG